MTQKIDSSRLDVIVIGAGPAGGSTARELAKKGAKVLLIEQSQEIGEPNYSTAGTPRETVEEFNLPDHLISAAWDRISLATPRVKTVWTYPETRGFVFDFAALRKFLANEAAKYGAEILVGTSVKEFVEEEKKITGVRYQGALGSGEVRAEVIVDATGHHELANTKLGFNALSGKYLGEAIEYQMAGLSKELGRTLAFFLGSGYAPRGYAWIFPMDNGANAKVGIGRFGQRPNEGSLSDALSKFIATQPDLKKMEPTEIHGGAARCDGGVKTHVYKNLVVVGDSAHQVNPLAGEGIRHSLKAGRLAAETIIHSLQNGLCNQTVLKKEYERAWKKEFASKWRFSRMIGEFTYWKLNDGKLDKAVSFLEALSPEDAFDFLFNYNYAKLAKYPKVAFQLSKIFM